MTPEQARALKKDIADIGSAAQIPGPRDEIEINRINKDVKKVWKHIDDISGIDSSKTDPDLTPLKVEKK